MYSKNNEKSQSVEGNNINFDTPMLQFLASKGIDFTSQEQEMFKLKSKPFMDLTVETWINPAGIREVSVCHYGEQNGDLMRDPEIVFLVQDHKELPTYFRNDYAGVERFDVHKSSQIIEIQNFVKLWVKNLEAQGHELVKEDSS